jgi:predicted PurR-regulated permease PerM
MSQQFNDKIKQVVILGIIILLMYLVLSQLYTFIPGILAAVTLYIISRNNYFHLVYQKKWKKGWAALLVIVLCTLLLALPVYLGVTIFGPKVNECIANSDKIVMGIRSFISKIQSSHNFNILSDKTLEDLKNKITVLVPQFLSTTSNIFGNLILMLFILYYMLYNGREMERYLTYMIPLKPNNINLIAAKTKTVVKVNALGIPLISIAQGTFAAIGYLIFGIHNWLLWGFLTGIFAFIPVVGTMLVWGPLVIMQYYTGHNWQATGLLIYSLLITGNVEHVARITILKKIGNAHPLVTILGVIVGLGLFGFIGLIFGPLLISYIIVLVEIYINEFNRGENK